MSKFVLHAAACGLTACLIAQPVFAQEAVLSLPPMVVSATQIPTPPDQVGSPVTVITADDIARNQWRTLPDALRAVPGVYVTQNGGPGDIAAVFIWGTNSNHTKVLIDGVDVSDPSSPNGAFDFSNVLIGDVARIEVLRGPQSGLYGSDAIGGVILIETKRGSGPPIITGTLEGGSFGTFNQSASLSGSGERFNYAVNVQHFHSNDTPVTPLDIVPPGVPVFEDRYDNFSVSTRAGVDISDQVGFNFAGRYSWQTLDFTAQDDGTFAVAGAQSTQVERNVYLRGEARLTLFDGAFDNRFGIAYTDDFRRQFDPTAGSAFPPGFPVDYTTGQRVKGDWRGKILLAPEETLLLGGEIENVSMFTSAVSGGEPAVNASNDNQAAFAEWQGHVIDRLYGSASIRIDHNDRFGQAFTWHVAPTYTVEQTGTILKASAGTGFKAPTLNQLFVSIPAFFFTANPNLQPERSLGVDAGFEQPLMNNRLRFGGTYFHNDIRDLIDFNSSFTTLINVGHATTQGAEAFASFAVTPEFNLRGDYTYTLAMNADTGTELLRRPKHKASLTASWQPIAPLTLAASLVYVGTRIDISRDGFTSGIHAPPYTLVNLDASYRLNETFTVFGRVENALDRHYQDVTGFLRPGLGVYGGIRVALNGPAP